MSETQTSSEIVVRRSSDLVALDELENLLITNERMATPLDDDETAAEQMSVEIIKQLLAAESDEELEQFGQATGWRELLNIPIEIDGFSWRPSAYEEGSSVFFVVYGKRLDTGDKVVLTTGSRNIMAQLANMARRETLGGAVREAVQAERPTKRGYHPLWLRTPASITKAKAS